MCFDNTQVEGCRRGEFGPFGEPLYERGVVSNYIPFRLYGMYKDVETGLYYNVRRYYDWRIGRYLQPDPVSDLNLYVYVNNSPYDAVDPVGMFETQMRLMDAGFIGNPIHEEITETAISQLQSFYPKLYQYGFRDNDWNSGPPLISGVVWCRTYNSASVANGANVADCLFSDDSSYHCDNSNFSGCYGKVQMLTDPVKSNLVKCACYSDGGGDGGGNWNWGGGGGGGRSGEGGGGGVGCSVADQRLMGKSSGQNCSCWFRPNSIGYYGYTDYGTIGQLIHPIQDFLSHSNAIFVPNCKRKECVSWAIVCLDWECAEYNVEVKFPNIYIPSGTEAERWGLFSGLYGTEIWPASYDLSCAQFLPQLFVQPKYPPPCDVGKKIMTHCMLNNDSEGSPDKDCLSACDQGDWYGDCGGSDNIQRNVYWNVRDKAIQTTNAYLTSFCFQVGAHICR